MSASLVPEMCALVDRLRSMRYPTALVALEDWLPVTADALREVAENSRLRFMDYAEDVLMPGEPKVVLGAYMRDEFLAWLRAEARASGGIVVAEADELISSWPDRDRRAFFLEFLRTESNCSDGMTRAPIVLASHLASRFSLPQSGPGQGLVWSPESP